MGSNNNVDTDGLTVLTAFCLLLTTFFTVISFLFLLYINSRITDIEQLLVNDSLVKQLVKQDIVKLPNNTKVKEQ